MDDIYEEQIKRIKSRPKGTGVWQDMVKQFHDNCLKRGFPKEAFNYVEAVRAYRPIGRGSKIERNQILSYLLNLSSMMPTDVRTRILRDSIASVADQEYLESIWPKEDLPVGPTSGEAEAQLENGNFNQLLNNIILTKQDHISHATVHIAFLLEHVNAIRNALMQNEEQGKAMLLQDGPKVLKMAEIMSPHIQEHMNMMWKTNKKSAETQGIFNAYETTYAFVTQLAQQYQALAKKVAQQNQDNQSQQMSQEQIKQQIEWFKVQQDQARKDAIASADIQRENQKALAEMNRTVADMKQKQYINDVVGAEKVKSARAQRVAKGVKNVTGTA